MEEKGGKFRENEEENWILFQTEEEGKGWGVSGNGRYGGESA